MAWEEVEERSAYMRAEDSSVRLVSRTRWSMAAG